MATKKGRGTKGIKKISLTRPYMCLTMRLWFCSSFIMTPPREDGR
jgi:hypothetical protein